MLNLLFKNRKGRCVALVLWSVLLALTTACYGLLVGPALRILFGGDSVSWPSALPLPSLETLRRWLPYGLIAVALLKGLAAYQQSVLTTRLGQLITRELRESFFAHVLKLSPDTIDRLGIGELSSRMMEDVERCEQWITKGLSAYVRDTLQVIALILVCFSLDVTLSVIAFGVYPLVVLPIIKFSKRLRGVAKQIQQQKGSLFSVIQSDLRRLPFLQMCGEEEIAQGQCHRDSERIENDAVRASKLTSSASVLMELLGACTLAILLIFLSQNLSGSERTAESVLSFLVSLMMLYRPVKGLVQAQAVRAPGEAAWERVFEILKMPCDLPQGGTIEPGYGVPRIKVQNLTLFRGDRCLFEHLDATLEPGSITILKGKNGSGKTSFAWALGGLLKPTEGVIKFDENPFDSIKLSEFRKQISWVDQNCLLERGTVRENLSHGAVGFSELDQVFNKLQLWPVFERLPEGLETPLGDGGAGLSGGEKQKLSLARALLRHPKLMIFDEPENHLDAQGIEHLKAVIKSLQRKVTILLITHDERWSDLADAEINLG